MNSWSVPLHRDACWTHRSRRKNLNYRRFDADIYSLEVSYSTILFATESKGVFVFVERGCAKAVDYRSASIIQLARSFEVTIIKFLNICCREGFVIYANIINTPIKISLYPSIITSSNP